MSEKIQLYEDDAILSEESKRKLAVEAALEIIRASALGGSDINPLSEQMDNLPKYADIIQASLEVTEEE